MGFKETLLFLGILILGYCLLLPIYLVIIAINEFVRLVLKLFLHISRSSYKLIGEGLENIFIVQMLDGGGGAILGVLVSPNNPVKLDEERGHFVTSVLQKIRPNGTQKYARLEKIACSKWGYGARQKVTIDLHNHIRIWEETLPANGEFFTETEFLTEIIPKLARPFENHATRPAWEWVIIPNVAMDGEDKSLSTVRVFRLHHSYMDGISMGLLITECLMDFRAGRDGSNSKGNPPFILDPNAKLQPEVERRILLNRLKGTLSIPYYLMKGLISSYVVPDPVAAAIKESRGVKHYGYSGKLKMATLRDIQTALAQRLEGQTQSPQRVRMPSVLASILVSALGQSLGERGKLAENSILALRSPTASLPYDGGRPKNQLTASQFYFPLDGGNIMKLADVSPNPASVAIRQLYRPLARFPLSAIRRLLPFVGAKFPFSSVFTCVPGTREKGELDFGGLVGEMGGWGVIPRLLGISVLVVSYGDEVRFWVTVDDTVMDRAEFDRFMDLLTLQVC